MVAFVWRIFDPLLIILLCYINNAYIYVPNCINLGEILEVIGLNNNYAKIS